MQGHVHDSCLLFLFVEFQGVIADLDHINLIRLLELHSGQAGSHELLLVFYKVFPSFQALMKNPVPLVSA